MHSTRQRINTLGYIPTMNYYSAIKRKNYYTDYNMLKTNKYAFLSKISYKENYNTICFNISKS